MNIKHLVSKMTMWKDLDKFYSYDELLELCNKDLNRKCTILFSEGINIWIVTIKLIDQYNLGTKERTYFFEINLNGLLNSMLCRNNDIDYTNSDYFNITKNDLDNHNFKSKLYMQSSFMFNRPKPTKFCLGSDMYKIMIESFN